MSVVITTATPMTPRDRPQLRGQSFIEIDIPTPLSAELKNAAMMMDPRWAIETRDLVAEVEPGFVEQAEAYRKAAYEMPMDDNIAREWFYEWRRACRVIRRNLPPVIANLPTVNNYIGVETLLVADLLAVIIAIDQMVKSIKVSRST